MACALFNAALSHRSSQVLRPKGHPLRIPCRRRASTLEARLPSFFHSATLQVQLPGLVAACVFRCLLSPSFLFPLPSLLAFLPALLLRFLIPPSFLPFPRPFPPSLFCLKADNSIVADRHALCRCGCHLKTREASLFFLRPSDLFVSISTGFANSTGSANRSGETVGGRHGEEDEYEVQPDPWLRLDNEDFGYCSRVRQPFPFLLSLPPPCGVSCHKKFEKRKSLIADPQFSSQTRIVCGDWHCMRKHRTSYTSTHRTLPRAARGCIHSYQVHRLGFGSACFSCACPHRAL
ncbi:hypothetical protein K438DRAFT_1828532 [Mycena galopus ATCC 62051]|nr:hypothetical protein K438DRAFT_1828532 [Mycena galopus ATCC 62051]